jgi:thioredoxin 1
MATVTVDRSSFEPTVSREGIVLIDCWAAWCGACERFGPAYERAAERHPEHVFAKLDTQAEKELVTELGIEHIPTLMLFRDGILLFKQPGSFEEDGLEDIVAQAESLDMDLVRAELEKGQA